MSEHLPQAKGWLQESWRNTNPLSRIAQVAEALYQVIWHLEAQQSETETPQSGLTSPESAGVSPMTSTGSLASPSPQPESATTAPTSSLSERGYLWEDGVRRSWPPLPSRITEPTSSTPATVPDTGRSASTGDCVHPFAEIGMSSVMNGTVTMTSVFKCHACGSERLVPGKGHDFVPMASFHERSQEQRA